MLLDTIYEGQGLVVTTRRTQGGGRIIGFQIEMNGVTPHSSMYDRT